MNAEKTLFLREILVATDFSTESNPAVEAALSLAEHFGARLHVLHVATDPSKQLVAHSILDVLTEDQGGGIKIKRIVVTGSAAPEIVKYATEEKIDLIVLGTHGRSGLAHALMGSVAEAVVRTAPCQVLTIGPQAHPLREAAVPALTVPATRQSLCLVCAKASRETICDSCKARVQGEALERKRREEHAVHL